MKRLLVILIITLLVGLGSTLWAGPKSHSEQNPVFTHYVAVQEALAADNFELAKSSLELLAKNSEGKLK